MSGFYTVNETVTFTCTPVSSISYQLITWFIYLHNGTIWTVRGGGLGTMSDDPTFNVTGKASECYYTILVTVSLTLQKEYNKCFRGQ